MYKSLKDDLHQINYTVLKIVSKLFALNVLKPV